MNLKYKIGILLIHLISITWRVKIIGDFPSMPSIIAFWHGKMMPVWKAFSRKNAKALVSQSKDGEILTSILNFWGYQVVRGSSSKGGKEALEQIIELSQSGYFLITPDGPQGPREQMKVGAVISSIRTGTPLILCGVKIISPKIFEKSWDKFEFPLPFSKIIIKFSKPILYKKNVNRDEINDLITIAENLLLELEKGLC